MGREEEKFIPVLVRDSFVRAVRAAGLSVNEAVGIFLKVFYPDLYAQAVGEKPERPASRMEHPRVCPKCGGPVREAVIGRHRYLVCKHCRKAYLV